MKALKSTMPLPTTLNHPLAIAMLPLLAALWLAVFGHQVFSQQGPEPGQATAAMAEKTEPLMPLQRQSATFILGDDGESANRYYNSALHYYTYNEAERTEHIVTSCRSLQEVLHHLDSMPRPNGLPWGRINLVTHSNEWSDMGVAVVPNGARASYTSITNAMEAGTLQPLANNVADRHTELVLHGCALGRNEVVLEAVALAFGGSDAERPTVRSSKYFILYESDGQNGRPFDCKKYLADAWYTHFPTGYRPANYKLAKRLNENYPEDSIAWSAALTRTEPEFPGQAYHYTFKMPVVWYETYASKAERPSVSTDSLKNAWLANQLDIQNQIAEYGFEQSDLTWTVYPTHYSPDGGKKQPAIKAIGLCTIVCVLKAFTTPHGIAG